jgi:Putative Ig domain
MEHTRTDLEMSFGAIGCVVASHLVGEIAGTGRKFLQGRRAPWPVEITNQSDALTPGTVCHIYCCGNLFADGGVPDYTWTLRSGQLPPGLQLTASPGRITGTPTARGTFPFVVRVTDSRGAFAERTFSITVN